LEAAKGNCIDNTRMERVRQGRVPATKGTLEWLLRSIASPKVFEIRKGVTPAGLKGVPRKRISDGRRRGTDTFPERSENYEGKGHKIVYLLREKNTPNKRRANTWGGRKGSPLGLQKNAPLTLLDGEGGSWEEKKGNTEKKNFPKVEKEGSSPHSASAKGGRGGDKSRD